MKRIIFLIFCVSILSSLKAQEKKFKEFSYTEFFNLIESEEDSVFHLTDAIIRYNEENDSLHLFSISLDSALNRSYTPGRKDTIHIYKEIRLNNVHFFEKTDLNKTNLSGVSDYKQAGLCLIRFHKKVTFYNSLEMAVIRCVFDEQVRFTQDKELAKRTDINYSVNTSPAVSFESCILKNGINCTSSGSDKKKLQAYAYFDNCEFYSGKTNYNTHSSFNSIYSSVLTITNCKFFNKGLVYFYFQNSDAFYFHNNSFPEQTVDLRVYPESAAVAVITGNNFQNILISDIDIKSDNLSFEWSQLQNGIINFMDYQLNQGSMQHDSVQYTEEDYATQENMNYYLHEFCVRNTSSFRIESKILGQFHRKYKDEQDIESANQVYVELKNLQTSRLAYQYSQNPTFKTFFTWKINQFLKIFSAYGTEPARAIIFSFYVILIFAIIYLFFPNSWDSHGKHRIIHRYTFFMKYLNRNQGIHEVYMEEKQHELLAFHEFKDLIDNNAKTVPRFFTATALPLYKWSLSGTKLSASLLSRFDVLKGTWQEVPPAHRWWKMILLIGAFLIAIAYDITIKVLNALMLSINTFTTLGFGEIPIKGLPRYLAILQGFIGWFMLTIFSVSLISQLLN